MNSKAILTSVLAMILTTSLIAQNVCEKTLVKSFNLQGLNTVLLELDGDVEVQEWDNKVLRIQMTISIPDGNEHMLKSLIKAGRYNLISKIGEEYVIHAPGMEREVRIKGSDLKEHMKFLVYAPNDVLVKLKNEASTSNQVENNNNSL